MIDSALNVSTEVNISASALLFDELHNKATRADRRISLDNVRRAVDYLLSIHEADHITYAAVAKYVAGFGGKPSSAQVIKNDKNGLKRYIDLRKNECAHSETRSKFSDKSKKVRVSPNSEYEDLLKLDTDTLASMVNTLTHHNALLERKLNQLAEIANKKIVIQTRQLIKGNEPETETEIKPSIKRAKFPSIKKIELIETVFQPLVDEYGFVINNFGISREGEQICGVELVEVLADSLDLDLVEFLGYLT